MRTRRWGGTLALVAVLATRAVAPAAEASIEPQPSAPPKTALVAPLALPAQLRVVVFSPHPDDETVAVGGLIHRLVHRRVPVHVVFVTNGDGYPRAVEQGFDLDRPTDSDYIAFGELRQREAIAAGRALGLRRRDMSFLGFPDGGLAELWRAHWSLPYTSPYTKENSSPYADTVSPDAGYDGRDLTSMLARLLRDFRPTVIVMPHPYDRHLDHVHTSYFVTEALSRLQEQGVLSADVRVLTYIVHYPSWPASRPPLFDRLLPIDTVTDTSWFDTELAPAELAAKRAALEAYKSQLVVMNGFLRRFMCHNELYGTVDRELLAKIALVH
jgi:LmbE family N-acetylglucosaminyl deacetylase